MLNKEELKSFQEESVIDYWYNTRSEDLYILNDVDKKKIAEITKGEELYEYPIGATGLVRLSGHSFYLLLRSGALRSPEAGQHRERCAL